MQNEILLTPDHYAKLQEELEHLKTVRRREVAQRIKQSIEFGDLSENSEYDDAKNEQARVEGHILELSEILSKAKIIAEGDGNNDSVRIGSKVTLVEADSGEKLTYKIVGSVEADPAQQKISNESPVGAAIMGQKKGASVKVKTPSGKVVEYRISKISS